MNSFWKVFLTAFISTVIVGGITFYFMNQKLTADNKDKDAKISDLTKQVADLSATSTTSTSATATTDATAGWKTYSDTIYGFSVKYPSTWSIKKSDSSIFGVGKPILAEYGLTVDNNLITEPAIEVQDPSVYVENWNGTLNQFVDKEKGESIVTPVTIGSQSGLVATQDTAEDSSRNFTQVYLLNNNKVYIIMAKYSKSDSISSDIFKELYSTFQFIK